MRSYFVAVLDRRGRPLKRLLEGGETGADPCCVEEGKETRGVWWCGLHQPSAMGCSCGVERRPDGTKVRHNMEDIELIIGTLPRG